MHPNTQKSLQLFSVSCLTELTAHICLLWLLTLFWLSCEVQRGAKRFPGL